MIVGRPRELEPSVGDLIESAVRKIVTAIVIAGGLIAVGLYSQAGPARYQAIAADGRIYRINTHSGTVIGCEGDRCAIVLQHGQELEDSLGPPPRRSSSPRRPRPLRLQRPPRRRLKARRPPPRRRRPAEAPLDRGVAGPIVAP